MATKTLLIELKGIDVTPPPQWSCYPLTCPPGLSEAAFWTSLNTSQPLSNHGHYSAVQFNPGTYQHFEFNIDDHLTLPPFWLYCSGAGMRTAVIDPFESPLVTGLNGIQLADWSSPSASGNARSWPANLINHIELPASTSGQWHEKREASRLKTISSLLSENEWDLFCIGINGNPDADLAGNHPEAIRQSTDQLIQKIIHRAGADQTFLVWSQTAPTQHSFTQIIDPALQCFDQAIGDFSPLFARPYFSIPYTDDMGAIRLNLQGRDLHGIIPADDYRETIENLSEYWLTLTCAETDANIVNAIVNVSEIYTGTPLHRLPDLLLQWNTELATGRIKVADEKIIKPQPQGNHINLGGSMLESALLASSPISSDTLSPESLAQIICRTIGVNLPGITYQGDA